MPSLDTLLVRTKKYDWTLILILVLTTILRLAFLDLRPAHHDEGINGWFSDQITLNGFFRYDPNNYHGPLHFYTIFLFQTLLGHSSWILRLPTVLVSILSVYWLFLFSPFLGRQSVIIAAIAMALSPAYEYFGRFAIHEPDLVFFLILILWGIIGLYVEGKTKYLWGLALGITGAILTKETYIIHLICFVLAALVMNIWNKIVPAKSDPPVQQRWTKKELMWVLITCGFLIIFFYSGNFLYFKGLNGLYDTFQTWVSTGNKPSGHAKPFFYWINLCMRYEYVALLGIIFSFKYLFSPSIVLRYTSIYSLGTFLAYSTIPYKTPWCIISILWPFFFAFGNCVSDLLKTKFRFLIQLIVIVLFICSLFALLKLNFINYCDNKEPYIYVQTFKEIKKLTEPLSKLVKEDPQNHNLTGNIIRSDEWPLPWLLWNFTMVGYYRPQNKPSIYDADFLLVESGRISEVEENLQKEYFTDTFTLREAQDPSKLYLSHEIFKSLFQNRNPEFKPRPSEPIIPGAGLLALFYSNASWTGVPVIRQRVQNINFHWEDNNRLLPSPFSAEFVGEINLKPNTALVLTTDDGGFLELDGQRVINDPGPHSLQQASVLVTNKSGWTKIRVGFYDIAGGAIVRLSKLDLNNEEISIDQNDFRFTERLMK